jgi:hypothetical protein
VIVRQVAEGWAMESWSGETASQLQILIVLVNKANANPFCTLHQRHLKNGKLPGFARDLRPAVAVQLCQLLFAFKLVSHST